jgi:hypothetical protein
MLNFKDYKPTYTPQPIEQISKTMEVLDQNNKRLAQGYDALTNSLLSLNINDADREYINSAQRSIASGMDQLLATQDYSKISGGLSRLAKDNIINNTGLKAAVLRNNQYLKNRDLIEKLYYEKGSITDEQYNYYYNQQFQPTVPDNNGVFDTEYRSFGMPAKAVDLDSALSNIARSVGVDAGTNRPKITQFTEGELAKIFNEEIDPANADNPTGITNFRETYSFANKSAAKIEKALREFLETNPEASAYVKDLATIRGVDKGELISNLIKPYRSASSSNYVHAVDNSGSDFATRMLLFNRAEAGRNARQARAIEARAERASRVQSDEITDAPASLGTILQKPKDQYGLTSSFYNSGVPGGVFSNFNSIGNLNPNPDTAEEYYNNLHVNEASRQMYGKDFNNLTKRERESISRQLNDYEYRQNAIKDLPVDVYTSKTSTARTRELFGDNAINTGDSKNNVIVGSVSLTGMYNLESGEYIPGTKVNDYLAKMFKNSKNIPMNAIGMIQENSPQLATVVGDYDYMQAEIVNIGGARFAVPNKSSAINSPYVHAADKFRVLLDDIGVDNQGNPKPRSYKVVTDPAGNKLSVQYDKSDNSYYVTTDLGKGHFKVNQDPKSGLYSLYLDDTVMPMPGITNSTDALSTGYYQYRIYMRDKAIETK